MNNEQNSSDLMTAGLPEGESVYIFIAIARQRCNANSTTHAGISNEPVTVWTSWPAPLKRVIIGLWTDAGISRRAKVALCIRRWSTAERQPLDGAAQKLYRGNVMNMEYCRYCATAPRSCLRPPHGRLCGKCSGWRRATVGCSGLP